MAKLKVAKFGDKGNHVQLLQEHLNENGAGIKVDGSFGKFTEDAVHKFQDAHGLDSDGVVGPATWAALLPEPKDNTPALPPEKLALTPRKSREPNITVNPPEGAIQMLDISHYQPDVDFATVEKVFKLVYLKCSEGLASLDPKFQAHYKNAKAAGVIVGAYHFIRPKYSAEAQAALFIKHCNYKKGDLPPVLDLEDHGNLSAAAQLAAVLTFMNAVEEAFGVTPILYASPSFINEMGNPQELFKYPLWIANYGVKSPHIPPPWRKPLFWQFAEQGKVAGIAAAGVDHNYFYGTEEDLEALIG